MPRSARAFITTFSNPGNVEVIEIDDCTEAHGVEFDEVTGDPFVPCKATGGGCDYRTSCSVTRCVNCGTMVAR